MADKQFETGRRVTITEISDATGVHRTTLSKLANQKGYSATIDVIDKLCIYFDVPVEKVITFVRG